MVKTKILIVEDSPEDYETTRRAFERVGLKDVLHHCEDGEDARDYLYRRGNYQYLQGQPYPQLILLDLNLPGTDGREVLAEIKTNETLKIIPTVALTTSTDVRDVQLCYRYGVNSYIHKPVDLEGFMRAIQRLKEYWFDAVVFP